MDKRVIYTLLLIFSINLSFAQQYFVLEKNTDEYQTKNYELNSKNLYGIDKKIYLYNLLFEDLMHKSSPEKTLVLFSVLPSAENNNDWEEIGLDSIQNKIISVGTLRQLSDQSLYKRTDLKYGSTTKYWNNYKIIVEHSGKYYSRKTAYCNFMRFKIGLTYLTTLITALIFPKISTAWQRLKNYILRRPKTILFQWTYLLMTNTLTH